MLPNIARGFLTEICQQQHTFPNEYLSELFLIHFSVPWALAAVMSRSFLQVSSIMLNRRIEVPNLHTMSIICQHSKFRSKYVQSNNRTCPILTLCIQSCQLCTLY